MPADTVLAQPDMDANGENRWNTTLVRQIDAARVNLDNCTIVAPISGRTGSLSVRADRRAGVAHSSRLQ